MANSPIKKMTREYVFAKGNVFSQGIDDPGTFLCFTNGCVPCDTEGKPVPGVSAHSLPASVGDDLFLLHDQNRGKQPVVDHWNDRMAKLDPRDWQESDENWSTSPRRQSLFAGSNLTPRDFIGWQDDTSLWRTAGQLPGSPKIADIARAFPKLKAIFATRRTLGVLAADGAFSIDPREIHAQAIRTWHREDIDPNACRDAAGKVYANLPSVVNLTPGSKSPLFLISIGSLARETGSQEIGNAGISGVHLRTIAEAIEETHAVMDKTIQAIHPSLADPRPHTIPPSAQAAETEARSAFADAFMAAGRHVIGISESLLDFQRRHADEKGRKLTVSAIDRAAAEAPLLAKPGPDIWREVATIAFKSTKAAVNDMVIAGHPDWKPSRSTARRREAVAAAEI